MTQEGQGVFGTWEVGVDRCDFCDRAAKEAAAATKPTVRIVRLCPEHADLAQDVTGVRMKPGGATCGYRLGRDVLCGAATTHVQLVGFYEDEEPQLGFLPVCRRHAGGQT
jgi:hypothetical protein